MIEESIEGLFGKLGQKGGCGWQNSGQTITNPENKSRKRSWKIIRTLLRQCLLFSGWFYGKYIEKNSLKAL